jgi:hypothetical protein
LLSNVLIPLGSEVPVKPKVQIVRYYGDLELTEITICDKNEGPSVQELEEENTHHDIYGLF